MESVFATHDNRVPYLDCHLEQSTHLESIFGMIKEECERQDPDWDLVESLIISFLRYILRFSIPSQGVGEERDARISKLVGLIEDNYKLEKKASSMPMLWH
ncbi:transcriptional regulator [Vibrio sp. JCM 19236]|nr:transcriptional regulator [Vibrio sp. JCM 19236]